MNSFIMIGLDNRKPEVSKGRVQSWQGNWKLEGDLRSKKTTSLPKFLAVPTIVTGTKKSHRRPD